MKTATRLFVIALLALCCASPADAAGELVEENVKTASEKVKQAARKAA